MPANPGDSSDPAPAVADLLVVDDAAEELRMLGRLLAGAGFLVRTARSGAEALEAVRQRAPDLVLLDVDMPEMSGFEVSRRLRADPELESVPVLFLSGLGETEDKLEGFAAGGVDYITKPYRIEELRARLAIHLELRRLRREAEARSRELDATLRRLREAEKLRHDLVHMVVHDMRSPLMGVSGYLELLETEQDSLSQDHREFVGHALEAARALIRHVDALLDADRLETNRLPIRPGRHDLVDLVERAISMLGPFGRKRVGWGQRPDGGAPLECDAELVVRVVSNLLAGALAHSDEADPVVVAVRNAAEQSWRVEVRDRGAPVPAEQVAGLFGTRLVEGSGRGRARSMGLGLAFCRLAVDAHHGDLGASPTDDGGNAFWFELPKSVAKP